MAIKILFADDQIPHDSIPDDKIREVLKSSHQSWDDAFIRAFVLMRQTVRKLRDSGHDVTVANTFERTLSLVHEQHFDVAIVDLMWASDESIPTQEERDNAGWRIGEAIEKADSVLSPTSPTAIVIYSSRFASQPAISSAAAARRWLPFFKIYSGNHQSQEAGREALQALIVWFERFFEVSPPSARKQRASELVGRAAVDNLREASSSRRRWDLLTALAVILSLLLVIAGGIVALAGRVEVGIVTSLCGAVTGLVPVLLFRPLRDSTEDIQRTYEKLADWASNGE
jgi:hypothetical protein